MYTGFMADIWLGLILLLGGTVGTACTVRRAQGPRERRILIWACTTAWLAVVGFVAGVLLIPRPFGVLLWLPYGVAVPIAVSMFRKRCTEAQEQDRAAAKHQPH